MRIKFVECKERKTAWEKCPWASVVVKVEGGFMAFESHTDYSTWISQK